MRYRAAYRVFGWLLTAFGVVYVLMGGRGLLERAAIAWPLVLLGLVAIVVGSALVRWARRDIEP